MLNAVTERAFFRVYWDLLATAMVTFFKTKELFIQNEYFQVPMDSTTSSLFKQRQRTLYYENHRTGEWARISMSLPHSLS